MSPLPRSVSAPVMAPLDEPDLAAVTQHEVVGPRLGGGAVDLRVAAQQARLDSGAYVGHARPLEDDRVLDLAAADLHAVADSRKRAHVGVLDDRLAADDGGAPDDAPRHAGACLDHHPAAHLRAL